MHTPNESMCRYNNSNNNNENTFNNNKVKHGRWAFSRQSRKSLKEAKKNKKKQQLHSHINRLTQRKCSWGTPHEQKSTYIYIHTHIYTYDMKLQTQLFSKITVCATTCELQVCLQSYPCRQQSHYTCVYYIFIVLVNVVLILLYFLYGSCIFAQWHFSFLFYFLFTFNFLGARLFFFSDLLAYLRWI